ncbi:MAG: hypothetical protein AABY83_14750 [Pseudomonadota bacterium]
MDIIDTLPIKNAVIYATHLPQAMSVEDTQFLYARVLHFNIDGGPVSLPFEKHLARENGWSMEYAQRVVIEYKRFVFLMVCAGHPVMPSDQVDQAWRLHLTYTHSYWDRLCRQVVGRALHHDPTHGGVVEGRKFAGWYRRTLESYQRMFAQAPPSDIWPEPSIRFGEDLFFQRINMRRMGVLKRLRTAFPRLFPK